MRTTTCCPGESQIGVLDGVCADVFLECLKFVVFPIWIVEIFVEQNDGAVREPRGEQREYRFGRAIKIAVKMDEGCRTGIGGEPFRQAVFKITSMKSHIVRDARQSTTYIECFAAEVEA